MTKPMKKRKPKAELWKDKVRSFYEFAKERREVATMNNNPEYGEHLVRIHTSYIEGLEEEFPFLTKEKSSGKQAPWTERLKIVAQRLKQERDHASRQITAPDKDNNAIMYNTGLEKGFDISLDQLLSQFKDLNLL